MVLRSWGLNCMQHEPVAEEKKPAMSRSEWIFNTAIYGGIAALGTFIATIPTTYWAKYGGGAKYFSGASKWLVKKGASPQTAEQIMMTTATMQGGNIMVFPVKWAEDHKVELVKGIADMLGEKVDVAALQAEDKQTWSSIVKARLLAWSAVFVSFKTAQDTFKEKFAAFENAFAKHVVCKPLGFSAAKDGKAFRYGKIAAIDVFSTAAASVLLYLGSRVFAAWERKHLEEQCPTFQTTSTPDNAAETIVTPSKTFATKPPEKDFATAALASRTNENLQLGA